MLFIFALPVMQVILFCLAIGRDPTGLHLAVVNQEISFETQICPIHNNCTYQHFSCRYLDALPKDTIIQVRPGLSNYPTFLESEKFKTINSALLDPQDLYEDTETAINAVKTGDAWGVVFFNRNFTDSLVARMALGKSAEDDVLDESDVRVWLDMSSEHQLSYSLFTLF